MRLKIEKLPSIGKYLSLETTFACKSGTGPRHPLKCLNFFNIENLYYLNAEPIAPVTFLQFNSN